MTKLVGSLPKGDGNGLDALARKLIDSPRSSHAVRRNDAAAVKCGVCRTRMDPWLTENGWTAHVLCAPARRTA